MASNSEWATQLSGSCSAHTTAYQRALTAPSGNLKHHANPPLAEEHDAEVIAQIAVKSWQSAYIGIVPQEYLDQMSVAATQEHVAKRAADGFRVYIAEIDDTPVGFVTVGESRDDDATPDAAEVEGLYVAPEHSRKGIGSSLWKQACEDAVEKGALSLAAWLFEENETARSFYESMGCSDSGARKTKVLGGRDISVMRVSQSLALWSSDR